jgi:DNA-binding beta-propeller fold protein YncE
MVKRIVSGAALLAALLAIAGAAPAKLTGGNGTLYIGGWPNRIFVIDEATEKVTGTIEVTTAGPPKGGPPRAMVLSKDRKRFYLTNSLEQVEILDVATRKSIDHFSMSEGPNKRTYIRGMVPDPLDRFLIMVLKVVEKKIDRYEVGAPKMVVYDLKEHKIARTVPWPNNEERENVNVMFSPDGKLLYFFADDVLIYDTTDFKQVDTWELSRPIEEGFGRFDFGPRDTTYEEPGYYTGIFTTRDPVLNRDIMGVARVNLTAKSFDFWPVGPAPQLTVGARPVSFSLAPDRKRAYGLLQEIGRYEFWTFDLDRHNVSKTEFDGRPRMALRTSTNGKILYIYQAGNTIDLYDASNYKYLRTLTLDADETTDLIVVPAETSRPTSSSQP